jgi:hypothetical protein
MPQALLIEGPDEMRIGEAADFRARLQYPDGVSEDVSNLVSWRMVQTVLPAPDAPPFTGDTLDAAGRLTLSPDRPYETTLAVMATFTEGTRQYDGARLVQVFIADATAEEFVPVDGGAGGGPPAGQGVGAANGGRSGGLCGIGLLAPALLNLLTLGVLRRARSPRRSARTG